jgi:hypothetical protein
VEGTCDNDRDNAYRTLLHTGNGDSTLMPHRVKLRRYLVTIPELGRGKRRKKMRILTTLAMILALIGPAYAWNPGGPDCFDTEMLDGIKAQPMKDTQTGATYGFFILDIKKIEEVMPERTPDGRFALNCKGEAWMSDGEYRTITWTVTWRDNIPSLDMETRHTNIHLSKPLKVKK